MRSLRLTLAVVTALAVPRAATAQRVVADITIRQGPIAGRVVVGDPYLRQPRRVYLAAPRPYDYRPYHTVTVYHLHHGTGWYRSNGYRATRIWYDAGRAAWYDGRYDRYPGTLREVTVYERDGRYYQDRGFDGRSARGGLRERGDRDDYHRGRD
jgi:hypothetical protein